MAKKRSKFRGPPTTLIKRGVREPSLKGFKPLRKKSRKPAKALIDNQYQRLRSMLRQASLGVTLENPKLRPNVYAHRNRDGSVDAEIRIIGLPRGVSAEEALETIWEQLPNQVPDAFISMGVRHTDDEGEGSADRRYDGKYQVQTNYQDASKQGNMVTNILNATEKLMKGQRKARRRKPQDVFIRLHWNADKRRPKR